MRVKKLREYLNNFDAEDEVFILSNPVNEDSYYQLRFDGYDNQLFYIWVLLLNDIEVKSMSKTLKERLE
jgi:hypothetical protein